MLVPAHQEQNRSGYLDAYEDVSPEIWDSLGVKGIERMLDTQGGRQVWSEMASACPINF